MRNESFDPILYVAQIVTFAPGYRFHCVSGKIDVAQRSPEEYIIYPTYVSFNINAGLRWATSFLADAVL